MTDNHDYRLSRQPGNARPVEPGTRSTRLTWSDLDDLLNTIRQASDLVECIHMAAESHGLTAHATGALQQVADDATHRLSDVMKTIEHHMHAAGGAA